MAADDRRALAVHAVTVIHTRPAAYTMVNMTQTASRPDTVRPVLDAVHALDPAVPIRPGELAALLRGVLSRTAVQRALQGGELPALRVSRRGDRRIWPRDAAAWLQTRLTH